MKNRVATPASCVHQVTLLNDYILSHTLTLDIASLYGIDIACQGLNRIFVNVYCSKSEYVLLYVLPNAQAEPTCHISCSGLLPWVVLFYLVGR